jgi:hypothetical protein
VLGNFTLTFPTKAIERIKTVLMDEYGASAEPSPDDELHSPIVWPNIVRLREVVGFPARSRRNGREGASMSAAFNAASWVQRAEAIGLARVIESGIITFPDVKGPEVRQLLDEWRGGSDDQCDRNTRAACEYAGTLGNPTRRYYIVGQRTFRAAGAV